MARRIEISESVGLSRRHAARLLHAESEFNALQPASMPILAPLRQDFGGVVEA
jgi:hypothetical protein